MRGSVVSVFFVVAFVAVSWVVAQALGFQMSLFGSLALSLGLTLVLNLVMRTFGSRRRMT